MFWTIAGFILLVAFASVVTGGVAVFRHFIGAVAARVKLETVRTKISLGQAEFELAKGDFQRQAQLLQLMPLTRKH